VYPTNVFDKIMCLCMCVYVWRECMCVFFLLCSQCRNRNVTHLSNLRHLYATNKDATIVDKFDTKFELKVVSDKVNYDRKISKLCFLQIFVFLFCQENSLQMLKIKIKIKIALVLWIQLFFILSAQKIEINYKITPNYMNYRMT